MTRSPAPAAHGHGSRRWDTGAPLSLPYGKSRALASPMYISINRDVLKTRSATTRPWLLRKNRTAYRVGRFRSCALESGGAGRWCYGQRHLLIGESKRTSLWALSTERMSGTNSGPSGVVTEVRTDSTSHVPRKLSG